MNKDKELLLDEIKDQITVSSSFIALQYTKVSANKANEFRRQMGKLGSNFEIVKKRLFVKALEKVGAKCDLATLSGHIGLVFIQHDPVETTKAIAEFSKKNDNAMTFVGARVEGILIDGKDVERLAKLPSKDQMRAEFLGLLEAPMAQTLAVMDALLSSVVYCLDNKAKE